MYVEHLKLRGKSELSFISRERQNKLIDCIGNYIKSSIQKYLNKIKYFSISIDSTFDTLISL